MDVYSPVKLRSHKNFCQIAGMVSQGRRCAVEVEVDATDYSVVGEHELSYDFFRLAITVTAIEPCHDGNGWNIVFWSGCECRSERSTGYFLEKTADAGLSVPAECQECGWER